MKRLWGIQNETRWRDLLVPEYWLNWGFHGWRHPVLTRLHLGPILLTFWWEEPSTQWGGS